MAENDEIKIEINEEDASLSEWEAGGSSSEPEEPKKGFFNRVKQWIVELDRKRLYDLLCRVLAVVLVCCLLFIGESSLLKMAQRRHTLRQVERQTEQYKARTQEIESGLELLQDKDSLEKYAREKYYMHAPNEDVYLIKEN